MITILYDEICPFRTTNKAWCVTWGDTRSERDRSAVFLPRSTVKVNETNRTIDLPEWLVIEKGLECYVQDSMNLTHDEKTIILLEDIINDIKNGGQPEFILMNCDVTDRGKNVNVSSQTLVHNMSAQEIAYCIYDLFGRRPEVFLALAMLQEDK